MPWCRSSCALCLSAPCFWPLRGTHLRRKIAGVRRTCGGMAPAAGRLGMIPNKPARCLLCRRIRVRELSMGRKNPARATGRTIFRICLWCLPLLLLYACIEACGVCPCACHAYKKSAGCGYQGFFIVFHNGCCRLWPEWRDYLIRMSSELKSLRKAFISVSSTGVPSAMAWLSSTMMSPVRNVRWRESAAIALSMPRPS